jgi:hypothetical protein
MTHIRKFADTSTYFLTNPHKTDYFKGLTMRHNKTTAETRLTRLQLCESILLKGLRAIEAKITSGDATITEIIEALQFVSHVLARYGALDVGSNLSQPLSQTNKN